MSKTGIDPGQYVTGNLARYLLREIPELKEVLEDFPQAHEELQIPSMSIFTGVPVIRPVASHLFSKGPLVGVKALCKYVTAIHDYRLQLDIWAGSKKERLELFDRLQVAMNPDVHPMAVNLRMDDYHGMWVQYAIEGYTFSPDGPLASSRNEWRVKVDVRANTRAIREVEEFIITEPIENNLETPNNIPSDEEDE
jgi:hypothetical protein